MARRDVIEVCCDRCGRTETQGSTEIPNVEGPEVEATFHGEKIAYADLCKRCREAVRGYFSRMAKKAEDTPDKVEPLPVTEPSPAEGEPKKRGLFGVG
jgi:hypothetical protein